MENKLKITEIILQALGLIGMGLLLMVNLWGDNPEWDRFYGIALYYIIVTVSVK